MNAPSTTDLHAAISLPPLPNPHGYVGAALQYCRQQPGDPFPTKTARFTSAQMQEYARAAVLAALAGHQQEAPAQQPCSDCKGTGADNGDNDVPCALCSGTGVQQEAPAQQRTYAGEGMFEGETIAQAAEGWAQWCDVRGMTGLPDFLRKIAAPAQQTLRELGAYLARVLDEDQWAHAEWLLLKIVPAAPQQECLHDETERLGAIWTRCTQCGRTWADDEPSTHPAERQQADVLDAARLDYLQRGFTVELVFSSMGKGFKFRIGGLLDTSHPNLREAIDAALRKEQP